MKVNLYDFDKTIYEGDSSTDFFFYALSKNLKILILFPKIVLAAIKYKLRIINKTKMKETIFSFLKYVNNVDELVDSFWKTHEIYIKDFYLKKDHSKDIIISASPEFLLKPICKKLNVLDLIGSDVDKKTGKFKKENCHGEEKVRRLNQKYKDLYVCESYSDSLSDIPLLKLAKKSFIVKHEKLIEKKFN